MSNDEITLRDIYLARKTIAPLARRTPLLPSASLSERSGADVRLKLETMQDTGAFKLRGAANKLLNLPLESRERGVVCVSTGNHGRAVAYVARELGAPVVVCLSELVPENKVTGVRSLGAEVIIHGRSQDEASEEAKRLVSERGLTMVDPFDDAEIIAGQGTVGLELMEQAPDLDTVIVPVGGGGLVAGVAMTLKSINPSIRVVGVQMERGAVMYNSLLAGKPILMEEEETLADSLGGGIYLDNRYTFNLVRDYVDDIVLLSEDEIAAAMAHGLHAERMVLEGGGASGIGALLSGRAGTLGDRVAIVLSGNNVNIRRLMDIAQKHAPVDGG
jgi:threonine dehydratase